MTCPLCRSRCRKQQPRRQPSGWVDTVVVCERCGWVGVVSELRTEPVQMELPLEEVRR